MYYKVWDTTRGICHTCKSMRLNDTCSQRDALGQCAHPSFGMDGPWGGSRGTMGHVCSLKMLRGRG